jgi:hypothetical protein
MIGVIRCKKREINSDPYTYGELYIDDIVVTVKKEVYQNYFIGDQVEYSFSNHVSLSGIPFHNLTEIKKLSHSNIVFDSTITKQPLSVKEIEYYLKHNSKFFLLIKVAFLSLVMFFAEMYFVARFELEAQMQKSTGKSYFLVAMFVMLFFVNFMILKTVFQLKLKSKVQKMMNFSFNVKLVEFVQDANACSLLYLDSNGTHEVQLTMDQFHQVKNEPVLKLSFLNDELFYSVSK